MLTNDRPDGKTLLEIYRRAALIIACDNHVRAVIRAGRIAAPFYSPRGQEIISAAVSVNLTDQDYVITIYRGLHDQLAKGVPLKLLFAELAGRNTGTCKGKGGPMHITHPETGVMVTTGVVGSGMPIANGFAWASQIKKDGRVTVCNFGDGASNIGAFHESLNMASVWKLPVIFVCQNNLYAEHTAYSIGTSVARIADRAASYSMPGVQVNGNDPSAMWSAAHDAVERARRGEGPTLIEAKTFRFNGHNLGDSQEYMPKAELEAAIAADPVPRLRQRLIDEGVATAAQLDALETALKTEVEEAAQFAFDSPFPDLAEIRRDVYEQEVPA